MKRMVLALNTFALGLVAATGAPQEVAPWIEETHADFVDGDFDSSGANLYVSAAGTIQIINRWDVNDDGYIDLFFGNTHDINHVEPVWIYHQDQPVPVPVPSNGGFRIAASDLNGDGRVDLVVGNRDNNVSDHIDTYVYWGQETGFSPDARLGLPAHGIAGIAIADLNGDGRPEVILANDASNVSSVYWNGANGLSAGDRTELVTHRAKGVAVADLNQDDHPDLVFANADNVAGGSIIYWGDGRDFMSTPPTVVETRDPVGVIAADLNNDDHPDIVFASSSTDAYIYWGGSQTRSELAVGNPTDVAATDLDANGYPELVFSGDSDGASRIYWGGEDGYSRERTTVVPTRAATSVTAGDYDGDGRVDLVFTELRGETRFETDSVLYLNTVSGLDFERPVPFKTLGAMDSVMADLDGDDKLDLAFANKKTGNANGTVPAYLYLGGEAGYSATSRLDLPASGANEGTFADFDDDGWTDVLVDNSDHDDMTLKVGARIFHGGPDGIDPTRFTKVDVDHPWASSTADFDRNGYLDILFSAVTPGPDALFVYWGSERGFVREERTVLPLTDGRATAVGDLNRDGYLDVVGTSVQETVAKIFWGGSDGFARDRHQVLEGMAPVSAEIADLNADGYPDVILCNFWDPADHHFGVPSYIYWGGPSGFSGSHRSELTTYGAHDAAVVDVNGDGRLDIIFSNYRTDDSRQPPSYIYWGGVDGFDQARRSLVPARGGAGMLAADLNRDGHLDLVFANHVTSRGDHRLDSMIIWGSANGLHGAKTTEIPNLGPHNMLTVDIGNRMTRELAEEYISSVHEAESSFSEMRLLWEGKTTHGTQLQFQARSASTREGLDEAAWLGPEGEGSYAESSGATIRVLGSGHRWVQYRAVLRTPDGGNSPLLERIEVRLQ